MSRFLTDLMSKKAHEKPKLEVVPKPETGTTGTTKNIGTTSTTNTTGTTGTTNSTSQQSDIAATPVSVTKKAKHPVSPEKDFTKTPNSVVRVVVAQGLFRGKSKQIYDYLWQASRGAINPTRKIRKTFNEIQKGSGLGSRNTVLAGISHLENIGLIIREVAVGEAAGNTYEVFTPEELGYEFGTTGTTNTTGTTGITKTTQKAVVPVQPDFGTTGTTQVVESIGALDEPKTLFKDNINRDDDTHAAFSIMIEKFNTAAKKLTGKNVSKRDAEKWGTLADLLILELEVAARRSGGVSSVPAFLTEVLRRQFFTARQQYPPRGKSSKTNPDTVGKSDSGAYEIKPLDEKGREAALQQLREFAGDDFLEDFKKWYTEEDWNWLMKELGK